MPENKSLGQIAYEAASKSDHDPIPWDDPLNKDLGFHVDWEAAASAVWDQAVAKCIEAIRQHPCAIGETRFDEGVNESRLEHIGALRSLMCQADAGAKGDTVSREGALQSTAGGDAFQARVDEWLLACFGQEISRDKTERNHRFLEEALELVQSGGCTSGEAHQLVDYVYGRKVGEMRQEVGGVLNTLAALCLAYDLDMVAAGDAELSRCWSKIEKIREKQRSKPKHSPLPQHVRCLSEEAQRADTERAASAEGSLTHKIPSPPQENGDA